MVLAAINAFVSTCVCISAGMAVWLRMSLLKCHVVFKSSPTAQLIDMKEGNCMCMCVCVCSYIFGCMYNCAAVSCFLLSTNDPVASFYCCVNWLLIFNKKKNGWGLFSGRSSGCEMVFLNSSHPTHANTEKTGVKQTSICYTISHLTFLNKSWEDKNLKKEKPTGNYLLLVIGLAMLEHCLEFS